MSLLRKLFNPEKSLTIGRNYIGRHYDQSIVTLRPSGLYQIGGNESWSVTEIALHQVHAQKISSPFAIFSPRSFLVTLIDNENMTQTHHDLLQNPIYLLIDQDTIELCDPFNRNGISSGVRGMDSFGHANREVLSGDTDRVYLRNVRFDLSIKGYAPARFSILELQNKEATVSQY